MPWPQSLSYKNQNESLKAGFVFSCFRLSSIDGVGGFWISLSNEAGKNPRQILWKIRDFWIFFSILLFSCWSWYTGFCMDGKIIFSPKKILFQTSLNMSKLVQIGFFFLSAVARGLIFLSGSIIVVVSLKANNFYRDFTDLC